MLFRSPMTWATVLERPAGLLGLFVVAHFLIWTIVPALVHVGMPMDVVEGYAIGQEWVVQCRRRPGPRPPLGPLIPCSRQASCSRRRDLRRSIGASNWQAALPRERMRNSSTGAVFEAEMAGKARQY